MINMKDFTKKILEAVGSELTISDAIAVLEFIQKIARNHGAIESLLGRVKIASVDKIPVSVEDAKNRFDKILDDYCPTGKKKTLCKPVSNDLITPTMAESEKQLNELETAISEKIAAQEKAEEKRDEKDALIVQGILALMEDKEIRWSGRFTKKDMERLEISSAAIKAIGNYRSGPKIPFLKKSFLILKRAGKRAVWEFEFSV